MQKLLCPVIQYDKEKFWGGNQLYVREVKRLLLIFFSFCNYVFVVLHWQIRSCLNNFQQEGEMGISLASVVQW